MDICVHKFIPIVPLKSGSKYYSSLHFVGTPFPFSFLGAEERYQISNSYSINLHEIKAEIKTISKNSSYLLLLGGEPCLQSLPLKQLVKYCKELQLPIHLETFGTKPLVLQSLIRDQLIDSVILKLYCPLSSRWHSKALKQVSVLTQNDLINAIRSSIQILGQLKVSVKIVTYIVPSFLYRIDDLTLIGKELELLDNPSWELLPFVSNPSIASPFKLLKSPSNEFMDDTKSELTKLFPKINIL